MCCSFNGRNKCSPFIKNSNTRKKKQTHCFNLLLFVNFNKAVAVTEPYVWPFDSLFNEIPAGYFTILFGNKRAKAAGFDYKNYLKMNGKCFY